MPLNLQPADLARYNAELAPLEAAKQAAKASGDTRAAKRARRSIGALYDRYRDLEPPPPPPTAWEIENAMSIDERVDRLERVLKIGRYSDD